MIMQLSAETETLPLNIDKVKDEYEPYKENNGGGMSPPLSPPPPSSPAPTMVPPLNSTERRENLSSSSPGNGGLAGLHHALHGLHNLHNLHNLHSLQNLQTQMAALAGLQGSLGVPGVSSLLHSHLAAQHSPGPAPENIASSLPSNVNSGSPSNNQNGGNQGSVPQMVLTAGQVAQGVQGAQLLIPTSQGIAVQPILTIPLGQAGSMNAASSLVNPLTPLHHLHSQQQSQHQQPQHHQSHHQQSRSGSTASSPLPTSSSSSSSSTSSHPLLGLAGLPPSLFHPHHGSHNNNNNNSTNNNNLGSSEKQKLPLPLSSPVQDSISSLSARLGGAHYPHHHAPPPSRYSPDFLDTHNQPTISQSTGNVVDGVNLDEIKEFAKAFKIRRLSLGLTQTQVGQALSITEGPAYSQSAICRFEKLDITPKSAQKIKPVLERWMQEAEDRYKNGQHTLTDFMGNEPSKKRKRRTSFTPQALEVLNAHFERNTHPSGAEITALAEQLGYEREVVRIWFCNKRQALKNTVRMMAKGTPAPPPPPPPPPHSSIN
ncbi:UNVERIFIED_CONTAM: hypothetical protein RMT77_017782 [Armadillidium vulgare]